MQALTQSIRITPPPFRILPILIFLILNNGMAQVPDQQFYGPHTTFTGPYYIRTLITYVQPASAQWTIGVDLNARTVAIFEKMNTAFNRYNIYFIGSQTSCSLSYNLLTYTQAPVFSNLENGALDIFDSGGNSLPIGEAADIPGAFLNVQGQIPGGNPASMSEILIHELGHCFGLSHLFTGSADLSGGGYANDCDELEPNACNAPPPASPPAAYCCGDYVADTPILVDHNSINGNSNCEQSLVDPLIFRNYMNYSEPLQCRTEFTQGQVRRMWEYLTNSNGLNASGSLGIQVNNTVYPASSPGSGPSGNIIVESGELVINAPVEMLPGATIRVKKGARLVVNSTISGACNQMWRGIIVEGSTFDQQTTALQGRVTINSGGKLEHAEVAIDVQNSNEFNLPVNNTGGGIVTVTGGQLANNKIGIRFGSYAYSNNGQALANISQVLGAQFSVTDAYRGGTTRPVFMDLDGIVSLKIISSQFRDLRMQCDGYSSRSIGIDAKNAGFRASASTFEDLYYGVRADQLVASTGSFLLGANSFINCYRGASSNITSGFSINYNSFDVGMPEFCSEVQPPTLIGVELTGMTNGFTFRGNEFFDDIGEIGTLIGTECIGLGGGLFNHIIENNYTDLGFGNRAIGNNSGQGDGLLYICNENVNIVESDFINFNGGIKPIQANIDPSGQPILPAGNKFSGAYTLSNSGSIFRYVYDNLDNIQRPTYGSGMQGSVMPEPVNKPTVYCADSEPCDYCPANTVAALKSDFSQNKAKWLAKKTTLANTASPGAYQNLLDTINGLRILMNRDGGRILKHYSLDTTGVHLDSILTWMANVQTFQTDLRLVKHHFFAGNLSLFDAKWNQLGQMTELGTGDLEELLLLDTLYTYLRSHVENTNPLSALSAAQIAQLVSWAEACNERGFIAQSLLRRNNVEIFPDCLGNTANRNAVSKPENPIGKELKLFPNPAGNYLVVQFPENPQAFKMEVFDSRGRLVLSQQVLPGTPELVLNINSFAIGMYFIKCQGGDLTTQGKFIISR